MERRSEPDVMTRPSSLSGENTTPIEVIDVFTTDSHAGESVTVIPTDDALSTEQAETIGRSVGGQGVVLIHESESSNPRFQYIDPAGKPIQSVGATIAGLEYLRQSNRLSHDLELTMGGTDLEFNIDEDGRIWITTEIPAFQPVDVGIESVVEAIGVERESVDALLDDLPFARTTGSPSVLLVPIAYLSELRDLSVDPSRLRSLLPDVELGGVAAFTFDTIEGQAHINSMSVHVTDDNNRPTISGQSSGIIATYLDRNGAFDVTPAPMVFEQGHTIDRPATLYVDIDSSLRIGGYALSVLKGTVRIPSEKTDEIIEV